MDGKGGVGLTNGSKREILKKIDETILNSKKKIQDLDMEGKNFPETKNSIVDDVVKQIDFSRIALEKLATSDGENQKSPLQDVVVGGAPGNG
jgi:ribosomal protein S5